MLCLYSLGRGIVGGNTISALDSVASREIKYQTGLCTRVTRAFSTHRILFFDFRGACPPNDRIFFFSRKKLHHYGYRSISKFDHRRMVMMCGGGGSGWGKVAIQQQMGNLYLSSSFLIGRRRSIRSSWPILSIYSHSVGE